MSAPQLTYYAMAPEVVAFSTTREGGVSSGSYASFNINPYCGDAPEAIATNRERLCCLLGIDSKHLIMPHQTHHTLTRQITDDFLSLPEEERQALLEGVDALMTDVRGLCIGVSTADSIPVLLYDPVHSAVCAIHAGWRGTVARIVQHSVEAMQHSYGTQPSDLLACIGPGISLAHFEVGDEVYEAFAEAGFAMEPISRREAKWHIDLPHCNRLQLEELGVEAAHIHSAHICTYADSGHYFSARRLGIRSGRIFTGILMR